jgi:phosphoribosylformylglycinamidine synthase
VQDLSEFAISLGINIPTGKDSMSMTQKYPNGEKVLSPGTVIITAVGQIYDITNIVSPVLNCEERNSAIIRIDFSGDELKLGGSSFAQVINQLGNEAPDVIDAKYFKKAFNAVQHLNHAGKILAGHDISDGGLIITLLEMCFADNNAGLCIDLDVFRESDLAKICFAQNPGVVLQVNQEALDYLNGIGINFEVIGKIGESGKILIGKNDNYYEFNIADLRKDWTKTSCDLDLLQSNTDMALERFYNLGYQPLNYTFPENFSGKLIQYGLYLQGKNTGNVKAAIIREKGSNGDREMAWALHMAGFDVKDVSMKKLTDGSETLEDVQLIVFVGGFSNSDVLGSAKGWAGAFLYNAKAKLALDKFYARSDTMSLGICNGCQLMMHLGLINKNHQEKPRMDHNNSGRFESGFVGVDILENPGIMLDSLSKSQLGIWVAHGEGKFLLPYSEDKYRIAVKYSYSGYPANPNGSDFNTAGLVSDDGRHLAMMPHPERCLKPYSWSYYPRVRHDDEITPWVEMFVNAYKWCGQNKII